MDSVITKFNVDDIVKIIKTNETGKVIDIVSKLGGDDNLYEVLVGNFTRLYQEKYLEATEEKIVEEPKVEEVVKDAEEQHIEETNNDIESIKDVKLDDVSLSFVIEDEINKIIKELGLIKVEKDTDSLIDACLLLKYLATRECNIDNQNAKTSNILLNELYKGLINREDNYITNSYLFSEILKRLGVNVYNIGLKDENGNFYMANLVLIKGLYYYFDVTVEQAIYNSNGRDINSFRLCSACIGSETYHRYFKPVSIIDLSSDNNTKEVPTNISLHDMDPGILNRVIGVDINA